MKFSQFHAGMVIEAGPITITEDDITGFARAHDPQWFHTDPAAAAKGRFGSVIASGWHTCAIAMRLVAETALQDSDAAASPGIAYIKWPQPVRPGDRLSLRADVLEASPSRSGKPRGKVRWRWRLFNQHDQEVLDLEATTLFDLSTPTPSA